MESGIKTDKTVVFHQKVPEGKASERGEGNKIAYSCESFTLTSSKSQHACATEHNGRVKTSPCIPVNFQALSQGLSLVSRSGSSKLKSWSHTKPSWLLCSDSHVLHQSLPDICFMFLIPFWSAWTPGRHREMAAIPSSGTGQDQSLPCCDKQGSGTKGRARMFANSIVPAG